MFKLDHPHWYLIDRAITEARLAIVRARLWSQRAEAHRFFAGELGGEPELQDAALVMASTCDRLASDQRTLAKGHLGYAEIVAGHYFWHHGSVLQGAARFQGSKYKRWPEYDLVFAEIADIWSHKDAR